MRNALAIFTFGLATLCATAQTPAKTSAPAASAKLDPADTREMNIREYIQLLRSDLKKAKSQVVGDVMQLDSGQAAKFWPVYNEFETKYAALGDQIVALVRTYTDNYDKMTDTVADRLANSLLSIEQQRNELKKKYYERMKSAVGAITAARFLQVENQVERLVDLQISAQLPIVSEQ
jgi:hypothetical protein